MHDFPTVPTRTDARTVPTALPRSARTPQPVRPVALPALLPVLGGLWWLVGSAALDAGAGTVVLALGLVVSGALALETRRRHGAGAALPHGGRARLLRVAGVTAVAIVACGAGLGLLGLGELTVPLVCGLVAFALFALAPLLEDRSVLALGGALLVLAAVGAVLALGSAGRLYPQGLVGMVAGALFWASTAIRGGLLAEARARMRS